jgi:hypothetical protein
VDTEATAGLEVVHVTVLVVALSGDTVAVKLTLEPIALVVTVRFNLTLVGITATVILLLDDTLLPSVALAVMVTEPALTPVTTPVVAFTVAYEVLLLLHVTVLMVAFVGAMVAERVVVAPTPTVMAVVGVMVMAVTKTGLTVTLLVAVTPPASAALAVMVTVPALTPVTTPVVELTVAIDVLLLLHVMVLLVAFVGEAVAVRVVVLPTKTVTAVEGVMTMLETKSGFTVTLLSAVTPLPSAAVARMVAVPGLTPVTTPVVELTVAIEVERLLHVTFLLEAFSGVTVAARGVVLPTTTETVPDGVMVMPDTILGVTATLLVAVTSLPSSAVALMVTVPTLTPVTTPVAASTVALELLLLLHTTFWFVALAGKTVAESVVVLPTPTETDPVGVMVMEATSTDLTITLFSAVFPLSSFAVATMVAVPELTPVTTPVEASTVAISVFLLLHVTPLLVAPGGSIFAAKLVVWPTDTETSPSGVMVMLDTKMGVTFTFFSAVTPLPSAAVARITVSPMETP